MDFDAAIRAHIDWKMKLRSYLSHPDGTIKAAELRRDDQCALGKWIHGEGAAYAADPDFVTAKDAHIRFHQEAANIVKKADSGQNVGEEIALGAKSPFSAASTDVMTALMRLKSSAR